MPRDGAIIFSDLIGKLDVLECRLRQVQSRRQRQRLAKGRGPDLRLVNCKLCELGHTTFA